MRKSVLGVALVVVIALAVAYLGSPYWTAQRFRSAAASGDADRIDAMTDLPAVKDSLKSQLSSALVRKMNADPSMKGNPFAAFGALIGPAIIDKVVDGYVTPDGLANMMKGAKPDGGSQGRGVPAHQYVGESEYIGLDRFRVKLHDTSSNEEGPALLFERRGIIDWKLIRIELPPSLFTDRGEPSASDSQAPGASPSPSLSDTAPTGDPSPTGTATPFAYIDTETQKLPSVGQCFSTTVHDTGGRLEGDLTSGTSVAYEDGHAMVDYEQHANIQAWRAGDPVRLCVTDLPKDCPPGDNRGVGYQARNQRTREVWRAGDSEHGCGGA